MRGFCFRFIEIAFFIQRFSSGMFLGNFKSNRSCLEGKRFDNSFFPDVRLKAAMVRCADFACVFFVCIFANDLDMFSYDQQLQPVLVQHSQFTLFITVLEKSLLA